MDKLKIERAIRDILEAIGEDPNREGLVDTPKRMARMYEEIFSGINQDESMHLETVFQEDHEELVLVKDIPFILFVNTTWYLSLVGLMLPIYLKAGV